jgi:transcription termination/antitermination protein NusA
MTLSRAGSRSPSEPSTESLADALTALCAEVGIPFEEMLHTVEVALAAAYIRAFNPPGDVRVKLDTATGALEVTSRAVRPDGSEVVRTLPSEDFKRMAAQTAKHAVLRHIHELERDKVLKDVAEHRGELATGIVDRSEAGTVYVDLGRAEGVMPPEEQIPGEVLIPGRPVLVVILDAQRNPRQAQVRVSRAARIFVHRLLEAEVPEIKAGTVQVRAIAREPGLRTKIAVSAGEPGIDPVGACVGPKGVRHRAILSELSSEHVDIVPWSDDLEAFVAASLGPAKAESVTIDRGSRTATVLVPRSQLSLAIGRDGQNARLAAKLTGYRIDIKAGESETSTEDGGGEQGAVHADA